MFSLSDMEEFLRKAIDIGELEYDEETFDQEVLFLEQFGGDNSLENYFQTLWDQV